MITMTQHDTTMKLKDAMRTEKLMGKQHKAHIGQAYGVGKSESAARSECEAMVVDFMENMQSPRIEVRNGYLIVSQVESSESAWYTIKRISDLKDGLIFSSCCMSAKGLKAAIESHLAQYMEDDRLHGEHQRCTLAGCRQCA